jgi:hypothetical protein
VTGRKGDRSDRSFIVDLSTLPLSTLIPGTMPSRHQCEPQMSFRGGGRSITGVSNPSVDIHICH